MCLPRHDMDHYGLPQKQLNSPEKSVNEQWAMKMWLKAGQMRQAPADKGLRSKIRPERSRKRLWRFRRIVGRRRSPND
jgi:hypothetical protein